jgi:hypothetical protein
MASFGATVQPVLAVTLKWIPWTTTLWLAGVCAVFAALANRARHGAAGVLRELAIILGLYSLWGFAGEHANLHIGGAIGRAHWIWDHRYWLPVPNELTVQHWVLPHVWLVRFLNAYYASVHIPSLIAFLVWLFVFHRPQYPRIRNVVAIATGACLAIQLIPVAPPRLTPGLGFVDTAARYGPSVYPAAGGAGPDQFSAMPSVHIAWATILAVSIVLVARSRWRFLALGHLGITFLAVVATANHWWLDGFVSWGVLAVAVALEAGATRVLRRVGVVGARSVAVEPEPVPVSLS